MKDKNEIKELVLTYLNNNDIKGHLVNDVLYMQSFKAGATPFTVIMIIGFFVLGFIIEAKSSELLFSYVGLGAFLAIIIGAIGSFFTKSLWIYDLNRNSVYTINYIGKKEIWRSSEIILNDIKELFVNQVYIDPKNGPMKASEFKGNKSDNPHVASVISAVTSDNKLVNLCEPAPKAEPHLIAINRCKMFSEILEINYTVCEKDEYIKQIKENDGKKVYKKISRHDEWKKNKKMMLGFIIFFLIAFIALFVFLFSTI